MAESDIKLPPEEVIAAQMNEPLEIDEGSLKVVNEYPPRLS